MHDFYSNKNVLVTGGLGFIGSTIAHALVGRAARITLLDSLDSRYGGNLFNIDSIKNDVEIIQGDIRDDAIVASAVKNKDVIFNCAAQVSYIDSNSIPFEDLDVNCRGHLTLLEACRVHNPTVRIVFCSSRLVYGRITAPMVKEDHPTVPLSLYGIHKLTGEMYHLLYHRNYGIKSSICRITNPYGVRQQMKHNKYSIVGWFLRRAMDGKELSIFGDGAQMRDYIYISDLVDLFTRIPESDTVWGGVYNCGSGISTPFREMIHAIASVVGTGKVVNIPWPKEYEREETGNFNTDISRISSLIDWKPEVSLREGIERMHEYYSKYRHHYWE